MPRGGYHHDSLSLAYRLQRIPKIIREFRSFSIRVGDSSRWRKCGRKTVRFYSIGLTCRARKVRFPHFLPKFQGIFMSRPSSITSHPLRARIDMMLDDGTTYAEIARTVGNTSVASVGRYAISRKSELAKAMQGEPTSADVLTRLVEAADHARDARRQSKLTGSPVHQARMIRAESDLLVKLLESLGVTDVSIAAYLAEAEAFSRAVQVMIRNDRQAALALLNAVDSLPDLEPFGRTLANYLGVER